MRLHLQYVTQHTMEHLLICLHFIITCKFILNTQKCVIDAIGLRLSVTLFHFRINFYSLLQCSNLMRILLCDINQYYKICLHRTALQWFDHKIGMSKASV